MIILHPQQDNKLAITIPCVSLELAISKLPANTPYKVVDTLDIVSEFSDAYEFDQEKGGVVNMKKAKEIKLDQFRQARKPLLEKLDIEFMRAVETSDTDKMKAIAATKQELRDITSVKLPTTINKLAEFWPDSLK